MRVGSHSARRSLARNEHSQCAGTRLGKNWCKAPVELSVSLQSLDLTARKI